MKMNPFAVAVFIAPLLAAWAATAAEHKDWETFEKDGKCWAATAPTFTSGAANRNAYLSITNFPEEGVKGSVAIVSGTDETAKADVVIDVDGATFSALPFGNAAFTASGNPEAKLISAMLRGRELRVTWNMPSGEKETDIYSLMGFSAAKNAIDSACR